MEVTIMYDDEKKLDVFIRLILEELETAGFSKSTIASYKTAFKRLKRLAEKQDTNYLTDKLLTAFLKDDRYVHKNVYCESRAKLHRQCARILESYLKSGCINWSVKKRGDASSSLKSPILREKLAAFINQMEKDVLKPNTICGYKRIVSYFLIYCQSKGYKDLVELKINDVTNFIKEQYIYHFKPTTIGAVLPGLKKFLSTDENGSKFVIELPVHLQRKRNIIEIYDENQVSAMKTHISEGGKTKRDTAICILALETGLRAVDICNLKLHDLDWHKDCIHITQEKTGEIFNVNSHFILT
jgi:site-specific recombinase XerD